MMIYVSQEILTRDVPAYHNFEPAVPIVYLVVNSPFTHRYSPHIFETHIYPLSWNFQFHRILLALDSQFTHVMFLHFVIFTIICSLRYFIELFGYWHKFPSKIRCVRLDYYGFEDGMMNCYRKIFMWWNCLLCHLKYWLISLLTKYQLYLCIRAFFRLSMYVL